MHWLRTGMNCARVALVLLSVTALPNMMDTTFAQSAAQADVTDGPAVLNELKQLKNFSDKLTDADIERLKAIRKQFDEQEKRRVFQGRNQGSEVWNDIGGALFVVITAHIERGGTGIEPPPPLPNADTSAMIFLTAFAMADFCADRGEAFQPHEIAKMKEKVSSILDLLRLPKNKRDIVWQAIQRGQKVSGIEQLRDRALAGECNRHREKVAGAFPDVLSMDVGKKNPFPVEVGKKNPF